MIWGVSANGSWKLGVNFVVTAETATAIDIRAELWIWTKYATWEGSNQLRVGSVSGSWSYTGATNAFSVTTNSAWSPNNQAKLWENTKRFDKNSSGYSVNLNASLTGVNYPNVNFRESVSASMAVAPIPYQRPATPSGLFATRVADNDIRLSWTNNSTANAPYESISVTAIEDHVGEWFEIGRVGLVSNFTWNGGVADRSYRFAVRPINRNHVGDANRSANSVNTTPSAPSAPWIDFVVPSGSTSNVTLSWTYPSGKKLVPASYVVVWSGPTSGTKVVPERSTVLTGMTTGGEYSFHVYARSNGDGNDTISGPNSAKLTTKLPSPPSGVPSIAIGDPTITGTTEPRTSSINLTWSEIPGASTYVVDYNGLRKTVTGTSTTLSNLTPGVLYTFKVAPANQYGTGGFSSPKTSRMPGLPTAIISGFSPALNGYDVVVGKGNGNGSNIIHYEYRITLGQGEIKPWTKAPAMSFTVSDVPLGQVYTLHLRAVNGVGAGPVVTLASDVGGGKVMVYDGTKWKPVAALSTAGVATVRVFDGTKWVLTST